MDQPGSSQPPPSNSTTENPIVAVGRKVKSVLTTNQRPSVRIRRGPSSTRDPRRVLLSQNIAEKPLPQLPPRGNVPGPESRDYASHSQAYRASTKENNFADRFTNARSRTGSSIRSLFGREENSTDDESFENEYDPDTVDLLDVMGMYDQSCLKAMRLTLFRPRSSHS